MDVSISEMLRCILNYGLVNVKCSYLFANMFMFYCVNLLLRSD